MARNLVKITFLFIAVYQGIQLSEASPSARTSPSMPPSEVEVNSPLTDENVPISQEKLNPPPTDVNIPPSEEKVNSPSTDVDVSLTPTDPLELTKVAFRPLVALYGKVGPLLYTLLTEKNALGDQISVISELIESRIGLKDYTEDMDLIFSNVLNPEVKEKALEVYNKIKNITVQNDTSRTLETAVEIITNILNDDEAVAEIDKIIKSSTV